MLRRFTESMRERVQMFVAEMQAETGLSVVEIDIDIWWEISPRIWGVYCVDRVEMCGQILLEYTEKGWKVCMEVKGKI